MTARDYALTPSHDSQSPPPQPARRRSHSTASTRSLSSDAKGVKNITRKVIKKLEGLGHLEDVDMYEADSELDERQEGAKSEGVLNDFANRPTNGYTNGHADPAKILVQRVTLNGSTLKDLAPTTPKAVSKSKELVVKKIDWEIPRKALHSSIGFFTVYLYVSEGNVATVVLVLWTALAVIVPADILRLRYPRFAHIYERFLGFLMRESEKKTVNGVVWYILGVNFVLTCYPKDVATVAILILSWADTAASTIGRMFGSHTPPLPRRTPVLRLPLAPRKSLAGFIAATLTGACIAVWFWGFLAPRQNNAADVVWTWDRGVQATSTLLNWFGIEGKGVGGAGGWTGLGAVGLVAGLVSGVAEALDLGSLDDNLTLPIISGGCILGFFKLLGLFSSS